MPRALLIACLPLAAAALAACGSAPAGPAVGPPHKAGELRAALERLGGQADRLLDGGPSAFVARVESLRGAPVVVNQWASWCGPCRDEFPFFQRLAARYRGRVAFLGVVSQDSRESATAFLRRYPVPYPHFYDRDASIARLFRGGRSWPTTAFYDRSGRLAYSHEGAYLDESSLAADISRYALHG